MGATVTAHGQSAVTDKYGYFVLQNVSAPQDRCVALAKMDGYFTAAKAEHPKENGLTNVKLFLMSEGTRQNLNAATGGTINVGSAGASAKFEANGLVTSGGSAFSGTAKVAIRHLDPDNNSFAAYFAGDQAALRSNGDRADLISYGVLRVDIRSTSGEQLQPAPGKPAEITYPIPASMLANAPASMPLWFFDEQKGFWVEEGTATKQGNKYVGTVTHFTDWNCDYPSTESGTLSGTVDCGGIPMPNVVIRIGQTVAVTDQDGHYTRRVPAGVDLVVFVDPAMNAALYTSTPVTVSQLTRGESRTANITLTSKCPSTISGTLTDDQDRPIAGRVAWIDGDGYAYPATTLDGVFHLRVPENTSVTLEGFSWACTGSKLHTAMSGNAGDDVNIGNLKVCGTEEPIVGDIDISAFDSLVYAVLSPDGSKIAINGDAPVMVVRNTSDGTLVSTANLGGSTYHYTQPATFSSDATRVAVSDQGGNYSTLVYNVANGNSLGSAPLMFGVLTPDGQSIIGVDGYNGQTKMEFARYSATTGMKLQTYSLDGSTLGYVNLGGITPDGTKAVLFAGQKIIVYDLVNDAIISQATAGIQEFRVYGGVGISADASRIAVYGWAANENNLSVLSTSTGQLINSFAQMGYYGNSATTLSPDGNTVVVQQLGSDKKPLAPALMDVNTGAKIQTLSLDGGVGTFVHFSFSGNGQKLSGVYKLDNKTMLRIWNL
jgi:hypothetical protein